MYVYVVICEVDDYPESGGGDFIEAICISKEKAINLCEELTKKIEDNITAYTWKRVKVLT